MKASLIVAAYKDYQATELILSALCDQTTTSFEVIIAEDNDSHEMKQLVKRYSSQLEIKHHFQEDCGIRKSLAQNSAAKLAVGDIVIFIDGDCIPYPNFIENHLKLSQKGHVLSGKRLNLGPKLSRDIRDGKMSSGTIASRFFRMLPAIIKDCEEGHVEAGLNVDYDLFKSIFPLKNTSLLGCNFSCYLDDFKSINGFDEYYLDTAIADDTDIEWRFRAYGLKISSVKFYANVIHLFHEKRSRKIPYLDEMLELMNQRKSQGAYWAQQGLYENELQQ